jgi:hypothetical protein
MEQKALIRFYRGNRFVGKTHPIAVVVGDTTHTSAPFSEHYVFHSVSNVPFLYQRTRCSTGSPFDPVDFDEFPEVFSADALLNHQ